VGSIYLIRHGQASFGALDYDVLSPIGVRQSQALGKYLADRQLRLDRCVAGTLRRQQDTATSVLAQVGDRGLPRPAVETDPAFNEFDAEAVIRALLPDLLCDEPEALEVMRKPAEHRDEFQRLFALIVARWLDGSHDTPSLEAWSAFVARVQAGLLRVASMTGNIAVFTSGGTLAAVLHLVTGMPASQAFELNWHIVNTSLSVLKVRDTKITLASFNSDSHLQLANDPALMTWR